MHYRTSERTLICRCGRFVPLTVADRGGSRATGVALALGEQTGLAVVMGRGLPGVAC